MRLGHNFFPYLPICVNGFELQIATKAPRIVGIGIDEETLRYFGLNRDRLWIEGQGRLTNFSFLDQYDDSVVDKIFVQRRRVKIFKTSESSV